MKNNIKTILFWAVVFTCLSNQTDLGVAQQSPGQVLPLRVATWNIENFGWTKVNDIPRVTAIAQIVRTYDLVAIQEISDVRNRVPARFLEVINSLPGPQWNYIVSERTGIQPDDRSSAEQYGFFFNTSTVEVMDSGGIFPDDTHDRFQREPFVSRFRSREYGFSFVLITIHTAPAAAVSEIGALDEVFAWAHARWPGERNMMALGDFNAGCSYASPEQLARLAIHDPSRYTWIVPDTADTNVSRSVCAYDRVVATPGIMTHFAGVWGVNSRAFNASALDLSDHWPVWTTWQ